MRILFVTASYLPTVNGISYHLEGLKKVFEKLGHEVSILAPSFPGYLDHDPKIIRYPSLPNPFIKTYPLGIPIVSQDKIRKINPQIIHTHHPLIIGQFAASLAEKLGIPLFFTAHTNYQKYLNYYFPHGYQITSKLIIRDLQKLASRCKKVICPTTETEKRLHSLKIKNTEVVFNGVENNIFVPPKAYPKEKPTLVFTGRIEKEKNPLFLIRIARALKKKLPDFRLIIIGSGNLLSELSDQIIKNKLENNITLTGGIARELLPKIYQGAHIFITPSKSEVMPLSILEAASCGLPIIALTNSNLDSIIQDGKTGFILPPDPKIISDQIALLFSNPKNLRELSENSHLFAQNFSVENAARKLLELYRS